MARNLKPKPTLDAVGGTVCFFDPNCISGLGRGPGAVWVGSAREWARVHPDKRYFTMTVKDLAGAVDRLLLDHCRIVWIEARGQIKPFHPTANIQTIRGTVEEVAYQGCARA